MRVPNTTCNVCKKAIYRRPLEIRSGKVFCSLLCCGLNQRKERVCHICGSKYIGIKRTCSRPCANIARTGMKYTGKNFLNNARNGSLLKEQLAERRGGFCERCGEENYSILQVHHKKERSRGGTDSFSNLEILCPNCHATHHLGTSLFTLNKNGKVSPHN